MQNNSNLEVKNPFLLSKEDGVLTITFNLAKNTNPFHSKYMILLNDILKTDSLEEDIKSIVLYGGKNRSFSAGGDFNETSKFDTKNNPQEIADWLKAVTNLYITILETPKPVIAAMDGHAIGFGLQLALCCDYRIVTKECKLSMPELSKGISCNFGAAMLEKVSSRNFAQRMILNDKIFSDKDKEAVVSEICEENQLIETTQAFAKKVGNYSKISFDGTKRTFNKKFVKLLNTTLEQAIPSHTASFSNGIAQINMKKQLIKNHLSNKENFNMNTTNTYSNVR